MPSSILKLPDYDFIKFEQDITNVKPRIFDTYILPPFMMIYAYKSKAMGKAARRALFIGGVYLLYRNYSEYKKLLADMSHYVKTSKES